MEAKEEITPSPTSRSNLTGFALIKDYLVKHDSGWVKDFSDDIDTLLVFAGLFSAVLTAFAAETYTMLQQDSTDTTNQLLENISSKLESSPTTAVASPSTTTFPTATFTPSTTARWINILFFLSLVLSLAAALFGILAKQWLREYMRWNSTLGLPRENVMIRQLRFEAWEAWNVPATISAIPALLEIAMIFFLAGIVILLWTLDAIVATVITVTIAAFMGAALAFTVLPIFFRRCPYKSPTAQWACVALIQFMANIIKGSHRAVVFRVRALQRSDSPWFAHYRSVPRHLSVGHFRHYAYNLLSQWGPTNLRSRLHRLRQSLCDLQRRFLLDLRRYLRLKRYLECLRRRLVAGWKYIGTTNHVRSPQRLRDWRERDHDCTSVADGCYEDLARALPCFDGENDSMLLANAIRGALDAGSTHRYGLIYRALSWVHQASQDKVLRVHVTNSLTSIGTHVNSEYGITENYLAKCIIPGWMLAAQSLGTRKSPTSVMFHRSVSNWMSYRPLDHVRTKRKAVRPLPDTGAWYLVMAEDRHGHVQGPSFLVEFFSSQFCAATENLNSNIRTQPQSRTKRTREAIQHMILPLLDLLDMTRNPHATSESQLFECIWTLVWDREIKAIIDDECVGLRSTILAIGLSQTQYSFCHLIWPNGGSLMDMLKNSLPRFIYNSFPSEMCSYSPDDIQVFILLCQSFLHEQSDFQQVLSWRQGFPRTDDTISSIVLLVTKMADLVEFALHAHILNCGYFFERLPWTKSLFYYYRAIGTTDSPALVSSSLRLLHALGHAAKSGLFPGPHVRDISYRLYSSHARYYMNMCDKTHCPFPKRYVPGIFEPPLSGFLGETSTWNDFPYVVGEGFDRSDAAKHIHKEMEEEEGLTNADVQTFVNIWWWCSSRQTGRLEGGNIPLFLASLPDTFALKFYPQAHSIHDLLRGLTPGKAPDNGSSLASNPAVDMERRLLLEAKRWDGTGLEQRRDGFIRLCREIYDLDSSSQSVSFERMVTLIADHRRTASLDQPSSETVIPPGPGEDIEEVARAASANRQSESNATSGESQAT